MLTMPLVEFGEGAFRVVKRHSAGANPTSQILDYIVNRPAIYRRNSIRWISACAWRSRGEEPGLAELKKAKEKRDPSLIATAGRSIADLVEEIFGRDAADAVMCIPCGHSKKSECFGKRLARQVADLLDLPFVQVFADRPCHGASHPKTRASLPPLQQLIVIPPPSVIIVDDVATSGWHLEEAMVRLRSLGTKVSSVVWISGVAGGSPQRNREPIDDRRLGSVPIAPALG
jgi:hypothetical protein